MGKQHGSLARAGKVRGQTPKVEHTDKIPKPTGRAKKRALYNKRTGAEATGSRRGPNAQPPGKCG